MWLDLVIQNLIQSSPDFKSITLISKVLLTFCSSTEGTTQKIYSKKNLANNGAVLQEAGKKMGLLGLKCLFCVEQCAVTSYLSSAVVKVYAPDQTSTWSCCLMTMQILCTYSRRPGRDGEEGVLHDHVRFFISLWARLWKARPCSEVRALILVQPSSRHKGQIMSREEKRMPCSHGKLVSKHMASPGLSDQRITDINVKDITPCWLQMASG